MMPSEPKLLHMEQLREKVGVQGKRDYTKPLTDDAIQQKVNALATERVYAISKSGTNKADRSKA